MKRRKIILIFGKTGSGKSYLANKLIKNFSRCLIIDAQFEYNDGIIFSDFESLATYHLNNDLENFTYVCRFDTDEDIESAFDWCYAVGNVCLITEEAEQYISPTSQQSNFLKLVRYGRHRAVSIIGIARTPTELSPHFRAQVDEIYSFKQTEPVHVQRMKSIGFQRVDSLDFEAHEYELIQP